jgi:hypothetical protein
MSSPSNPQDPANSHSFRASLIAFAFGLTILAFLVAIERPEWFHIRPVSGVAAAMSNASTNGPAFRAGGA